MVNFAAVPGRFKIYVVLENFKGNLNVSWSWICTAWGYGTNQNKDEGGLLMILFWLDCDSHQVPGIG